MKSKSQPDGIITGAAWSWARAPRSAWLTPSAPTPRSRLATWAPGEAGGAGPARGGSLSPRSPLPPGALGQVVPPVQSVLRCTFPHLQGLLLTLQGPSGPSVTPGTPRARLPEGLAQDLGSEHSCTLPRRPRPCGVLPPQLNAPGDTLSCRRPSPLPAPSPQSPPAGRPLPGLLPTHAHRGASPLLFLVSSQPSAQGSVCGAVWRVGSVRKRGRDFLRCPEQGLGPRAPCPPSPPAAAWSPPVPRAPK